MDEKKGSVISLAILVLLVFAFKSSILDANNIPSGSMIPTLKIGDYLFVNKMRYSLRLPFTSLELVHIDDPKRGDIITFIPPGDEGKQYVKRVIGLPGDRLRIRNESACKSKIKQADQKDYRCDPALGFSSHGEPVIAIVEYKERDKGDWKTVSIREVSSSESRAILSDADNVKVLHPDLFPPTKGNFLPVVFEEKIGQKTHQIVETAEAVVAYNLCSGIETDGCVIPEENYVVMGDNRDDSKDSRFIGFIHRDKILGKAVIIYFSINWRDDICSEYIALGGDGQEGGFLLEDFPPEKQRSQCTLADVNANYENLLEYASRTILYRIPRLAVRWTRIGTLLE